MNHTETSPEIDVDNIDWNALNPDWNEHYNPVTQERARMSELQDKIVEVEHMSMILMRYIMQVIDFRSEAIGVARKDNLEDIKFFLKMKFPMMQGSSTHSLFRKLSKYLANSDYDLKTGKTFQYLYEKYLKEDEEKEAQAKENIK